MSMTTEMPKVSDTAKLSAKDAAEVWAWRSAQCLTTSPQDSFAPPLTKRTNTALAAETLSDFGTNFKNLSVMKYLGIILWTMTVVLAALLFVAAIFVHANIITFGLAFAVALLAYSWWDDEIRHRV